MTYLSKLPKAVGCGWPKGCFQFFDYFLRPNGTIHEFKPSNLPLLEALIMSDIVVAALD